MLTRLTARHFGCLRDVSVDLTPVHAFIGPNDSGKSTLLEAVRVGSSLAAEAPEPEFSAWYPDVQSRNPGTTWLALDAAHGNFDARWHGDGTPRLRLRRREGSALHGVTEAREGAAVLSEFAPCARLRLDPDALRRSSALVPDDQVPQFFKGRGQGLPGMLMRVLLEADGSLGELGTDFRAKFPSVARLKIPPKSSKELRIEIELTTGEIVQAAQMSEGMLYYLAFAVLRYVRPVHILLVEEPENGLHPSRIADVMEILKGLAEGPNPTQVLIATHSPLVINELQPEQVSLVTRSPTDGTRVTPIIKTKNFAERRELYALGELWLSYADGIDESELVP